MKMAFSAVRSSGGLGSGYRGRARVVQADVLGVIDGSVVDTGELLEEGGSLRQELLTVDVIDARAVAVCGPASTGATTIANLRVGGIAIEASGAPNQTIDVAGVLRVVLNEQLAWSDGIRVRALPITALGALQVADAIVASAEAHITCTSACPPVRQA